LPNSLLRLGGTFTVGEPTFLQTLHHLLQDAWFDGGASWAGGVDADPVLLLSFPTLW